MSVNLYDTLHKLYCCLMLLKCIIVNFEITPSPLTVAVEQRNATFYCQHTTSDSISWIVNGISLNMINSSNIRSSSSTEQNDGVKIYSLLIMGNETLLELNHSTIECVAVFFDGSPSQLTQPVTLLVQGLCETYIISIF